MVVLAGGPSSVHRWLRDVARRPLRGTCRSGAPYTSPSESRLVGCTVLTSSRSPSCRASCGIACTRGEVTREGSGSFEMSAPWRPARNRAGIAPARARAARARVYPAKVADGPSRRRDTATYAAARRRPRLPDSWLCTATGRARALTLAMRRRGGRGRRRRWAE